MNDYDDHLQGHRHHHRLACALRTCGRERRPGHDAQRAAAPLLPPAAGRRSPSRRPGTGSTTSPCWPSSTSAPTARAGWPRRPPPASCRSSSSARSVACIADRFDRRRVMVVSDVAPGRADAGAGRASRWPGCPSSSRPILAGLATAAAAPYPPCTAATTPRLVPDVDLPGANAAAVGGRHGRHRGRPGRRRRRAAARAAEHRVPDQRRHVRPLRAGGAVHPGAARRSPRRRRVGERQSIVADVVLGARALRGHPVAVRLRRRGRRVQRHLRHADRPAPAAQPAPRPRRRRLRLRARRARGRRDPGDDGRRPGRPQQPAARRARRGAAGARRPVQPDGRDAVAAGPAAAGPSSAAPAPSLVEVLCETALQRELDEEVFARAYGVALPVILAGIVGRLAGRGAAGRAGRA